MPFGGIIQYIGFSFVRTICVAIQFVTWKVTGISRKVEESKNANYETGAQLLDIYWRGGIVAQDYGSHNFITTHNSFAHPNIVLCDNFSLYSLTENEALFIRAPENKQVWRSDVNPFIYAAQFDHAEQLVIVPLKHFHRLVEDMSRPEIPVIFLFNTARCGTTLLTQVFEAIPGGIGISEPYWLNMLCSMKREGKNIDLLVQHCVNICCKPRAGARFYCIKLMGQSIELLEHIARQNQHKYLLYMYRKDPSKFVISLTRMMDTDFVYKVLKYAMQSKMLLYLWPKLCNYVLNVFSYPDLFPWVKHELLLVDPVTLLFAYLGFSKVFVLNAQTQYKVAGIRYEDILENPVDICKVILTHCDIHIPSNLHLLIQTVFGRDSQQGTQLDRKKMEKIRVVITGKQKKELKLFADNLKKKYDFDMQVPGDIWCLPNTITVLGKG